MRMLLTAIIAIWSMTTQGTDAVAVLASGAVEGSIVALKDSLPPAAFSFETSQGIATRLDNGDSPDVLIAQTGMVDRLIAARKALADARVALGRMPIGVATGADSQRPDIRTVEAVKAAILRADAVVISRGASGAFLETVFNDLGIASRIASKIHREARGDEVMQRLATTRGNAIGFTMVSEIKYGERHGARYLGPLPAALQNETPYDAVVLAAARNADAARAFVRALQTPNARHVLAGYGWKTGA